MVRRASRLCAYGCACRVGAYARSCPEGASLPRTCSSAPLAAPTPRPADAVGGSVPRRA
ncbi:hypothetical protein GA0115246_104756, partial [Streptomyces sp. SolWspMP-sol7th]